MAKGALTQSKDVVGHTQVTDAADVVIIGSGAAGATAARVLTEAGLEVIIIEEGPAVPTKQFTPDAYGSFKRLWRDSGFQAARGRGIIPVLQGCALGGTTVINGAIMHRLPEPVHQQWRREGHTDATLGYEHLERIWKQLDEELSVGPTPKEVLGNNSRAMRMGLEGVGAGGNVIRRNVRSCQATALCAQGCPTERKRSMNVTYIPRAIHRGARVYATCKVSRILTRGGRATGVVGRFEPVGDQPKSAMLVVDARKAVILAASAIQTPLLLKACGVGRHSKLVGKRFQGHPGTSVMAVFDKRVNMTLGATQGYETTALWGKRLKFESIATPLEVAAARIPGFGPTYMKRLAQFPFLAQWGMQVRAHTHGTVSKGITGRPRIRFRMSQHDVRIAKDGIKLLGKAAFAAGAKAVYLGVHGLPEVIIDRRDLRAIDSIPDDARHFHFIMSHLFGTACMHSDPDHGVVNTEGECFEVKGLYVFDSSIFPTNLGVNPQHTICAIAWRLSERLAERVR